MGRGRKRSFRARVLPDPIEKIHENSVEGHDRKREQDFAHDASVNCSDEMERDDWKGDGRHVVHLVRLLLADARPEGHILVFGEADRTTFHMGMREDHHSLLAAGVN